MVELALGAAGAVLVADVLVADVLVVLLALAVVLLAVVERVGVVGELVVVLLPLVGVVVVGVVVCLLAEPPSKNVVRPPLPVIDLPRTRSGTVMITIATANPSTPVSSATRHHRPREEYLR